MGKRKKSGQKRKPQPSELVKLIRTPTGSKFDCPVCSGKDTFESKIKATHSGGGNSGSKKPGKELFSLASRTTISAKVICKNCSLERTINKLQKTEAPIDVYYKFIGQLEREKKKKKEEVEDYYDDLDDEDEEDIFEEGSDEEPLRKKAKKKSTRSYIEDEDDDDDDDEKNLFGDDDD